MEERESSAWDICFKKHIMSFVIFPAFFPRRNRSIRVVWIIIEKSLELSVPPMKHILEFSTNRGCPSSGYA
jgi:hypothetical protein